MTANSDFQNYKSAEPTRHESELAYSGNDQIIYLILIAIASFTLVIARILQPSPKGFGTHEQLGLPPCAFLHLTGFPCPGCGLTTSFAHAARFDFHLAFVAQPFGLIAFFLTVLSIPLLLILIRKRVAWFSAIRARGTDVLLYLLIAAYLGSWVYKIVVMR